MLASSILSTLVVAIFPSISAAQNVCRSSPYDSFACLTNASDAASVCASAPLQTITTTSTTTTLDVNTLYTTTQVSSQVTVAVTSFEPDTTTVTIGAIATVTTVRIIVSTDITTRTTYVPCSTTPAIRIAALPSPSCHASQAIRALGSLPQADHATACSCIGKPPRMITSTVWVTAPPAKTWTTRFAGLAPTTTLYKIALITHTVTVASTTTITLSTTSCTTLTRTASYAVPSFSRARLACGILPQASTRALDDNDTDLHDAVQKCKELCAQDGDCLSVYIDRSGAGGAHFRCTLGEEHFDKMGSAGCDAASNEGVGYNAYGRGTGEL